jgi:hypothetical protein
MAQYVRCIFQPGRDNNYLIAGNVCNAFALGELGAVDDFFLIGSEPSAESPYPLLTGTVLDSEGNVLFRLVRNVLVINPASCSRIRGDMLGYEIHDGAGQFIFSVRTQFAELEGLPERSWVTTLSGNFYDKNRRLVFAASSGEQGEYLEATAKHAFGFAGDAVSVAIGMDDDEKTFAKAAVASHGVIHQLVRGEITGGPPIDMDGKYFMRARLRKCHLRVARGGFCWIAKPALASALLSSWGLQKVQSTSHGVWQDSALCRRHRRRNPILPAPRRGVNSAGGEGISAAAASRRLPGRPSPKSSCATRSDGRRVRRDEQRAVSAVETARNTSQSGQLAPSLL